MSARVAVVGVGAWGTNLARNFAELGALTAACDTSEDARARVRAAHDVPVFDDYFTLLADPSIDAVALATPSGTHEMMALAALEAGKDVLVEKPVALDAAGARRLCDEAERRDLVLMAGHVLRYHPAVEKMAAMVRAGDIGPIRFINANRLDFGCMGDEGESVLLQLATHDISLALHLVGQRPTQVHCEAGHYLSATTADVAFAHLLFPDGVRADLHASWLHPYKDQRLVVGGARGTLVFDDQKPWAGKLVHHPHDIDWASGRPVATRGDSVPIDVPEVEPLKQECAHFLGCISQRIVPRSDGREALAVLEVVALAQASLDRGIPVDASGPPPRAEQEEAPMSDYFIHETAVVDGPVEIGEGTKVWHFSKLLGPLTIGKGCSLGQNVVVERNVTLGDNVKIQNNVSVYSGVILEDDVFCGPSMVFTNVGTPRSGYPRKGSYEVTRVKQGASIGANATVVCGHTLGRYSFVGAGAVVTKDVPDYALVYGNPARLRAWACFCGETLQMGVEADVEEGCTCEACGRIYTRHGHTVRETGA